MRIEELDVLSYFTILCEASKLGDDVTTAAKVLVEKLKSWYKGNVNDWDQENVDQAFQDIFLFIKLIKDDDNIFRELDEIRNGENKERFPLQSILKKIPAYQNDIIDGNLDKLEEKSKHLRDKAGDEVYVERIFKNTKTQDISSNIEDLLFNKKTTLLKSVAGGGKSSLCAKVMQEWVTGEKIQDIMLCLFMSSGSSEKISLTRLIWDEYDEVSSWEDHEEIYQDLQRLAKTGRLAVIIDGLDEFGQFSKKDVANAARIAADPKKEVDIKTTCLGLLSQKILPGAKILATGRDTDYINRDLLKSNADTYQIVDLNEEDRTMLVQKLEPDSQRRVEIFSELKRISTVASEHFLKTPFMTRNVIKLIQMKNVNIKDLKSQSDVYLMILLSNLDFHSDTNKAFTTLDPPEEHDYLTNCLKIGQHEITNNDQKVKGFKKNIPSLNGGSYQVFETKAFGEMFQIPIKFLQKLGIFDIVTDGTDVSLNIIHLSYLEFLAAASLLRPGVNIKAELDKITSLDRYKALVRFMAGFFNRNTEIEFLNNCKSLKENFLHLLQNETQKESVQEIFWSIIKNEKWNNADVELSSNDKNFNMSAGMMTLLDETMKITSDNVGEFVVTTINMKNLTLAAWATMATLVKTGHIETLQIKDIRDVADENRIGVMGQVNTLKIVINFIVHTVEMVASIGRLLRSAPVVEVNTLCLSYNKCNEISVNRDTMHIGCFAIDHRGLLPSFLLDFLVCNIDTVYVKTGLSRDEWHQVSYLLSHCRVRELIVFESVFLVNISREDIRALMSCVQEMWRVGNVVIYKEEGIEKLLQLV